MSFCEKSILAKEERKFAFKVDFFVQKRTLIYLSYTREVITLGFWSTGGLTGTTLVIIHTTGCSIMKVQNYALITWARKHPVS